MALKVFGLVGIPKNVQVQEIRTKSGWILKFEVASPNPESKTFYRYPISVWVDDKHKDQILNEITGGSVFSIEGGVWEMRETPKSTRPYPELKLVYKDFVKLAKPLWYQEREQ